MVDKGRSDKELKLAARRLSQALDGRAVGYGLGKDGKEALFLYLRKGGRDSAPRFTTWEGISLVIVRCGKIIPAGRPKVTAHG
jgi:hypothetical protein